MIAVLKKWLDHIFADEEALILLLLIFGSLLLIITMGGVLAPVLISIVLAFLMQGLIAQLSARGAPQWLAVSVAFAVFIGSFFAIILIIFPMVWSQLGRLVVEWPSMASQWQHMLLVLPERYPEYFSPGQIQEWTELARAEMGAMGQWLVSFSLASLGNAMSLLVYLILVPILVFFFLKDRRIIQSWLAAFLPEQRPILNRVWDEMIEQVANYVRGKAIEILIVGAVSYVAFASLGLAYAELLGLLVGLSVLVPYIGAAVVTVPVLMIGFMQWGSGSEFMTLFIVYAVIQALDGNILVPLLFSEAVNLHPVAIILAVLVFGGLWGFWGVFFAIPLATLTKAVLHAWPAANAEISPSETSPCEKVQPE